MNKRRSHLISDRDGKRDLPPVNQSSGSVLNKIRDLEQKNIVRHTAMINKLRLPALNVDTTTNQKASDPITDGVRTKTIHRTNPGTKTNREATNGRKSNNKLHKK